MSAGSSDDEMCWRCDDHLGNCRHGEPCDDCGQLGCGGDCRDDDERELARGTSQCDGSCVPMCGWCLVSHSCPEDCGGGDKCPYSQLIHEGEI